MLVACGFEGCFVCVYWQRIPLLVCLTAANVDSPALIMEMPLRNMSDPETMATAFWDSTGVIFVDILDREEAVNAAIYFLSEKNVKQWRG